MGGIMDMVVNSWGAHPYNQGAWNQNQDLTWIENLNKVKKFKLEDYEKKLARIEHFKNFLKKLEHKIILNINSNFD